MLAGCFGGGESYVEEAEDDLPIWLDYQIIDPIARISPWEFTTIDLNLNQSTSTSWAVFNKDYGGNCCEHYLATTIDGTILNIGGEYPVWSHDRGHEWDTYIPGVSQIQCTEPQSQLTQDRKVSEKVALFKQQMVTSSPCLGSHTLEGTSN